MSAKDTGGTAFPMQDQQAIHSYAMAAIACVTDADERDRAYALARAQAIGGMSLRDYFAAKAMQSILSLGSGYDYGELSPIFAIPKQAYELADAMLKARAA